MKSHHSNKRPPHRWRDCLQCHPGTVLYSFIIITILVNQITAQTHKTSSVVDTTSKSSNVKETSIHHTEAGQQPRADKLTSENGNGNQCPHVCSCIWKGGKQTATCDGRSLTALPVGLDSGTQVIDLTGNALTILPPNVFLERGLINLQRIHLVNCSLGEFSILLECALKEE